MDAQLQKQAAEVNRKYHAEFRRDPIITVHPDSVVESLLPSVLYRRPPNINLEAS